MNVIGAGWVSEHAYGSVQKQIQKNEIEDIYPSLKEDGILGERVKNFGRFDTQTRRAFCASALALHDANVSPSTSPRTGKDWKNIALVGTGREESTHANQAYFKDYMEHGRQLARANLFIYTLPTSPLAEIAIYFKLGGPLFYTESLSNQEANLLHSAERLIDENSASSVLAIWMEQDLTAAFLLKKGSTELPEADHPSRWIQFLEETL